MFWYAGIFRGCDFVYMCVVHSIKMVLLAVCMDVNRGYYPKGGGEVLVTVNPVKQLSSISMMERGTITKIYGRAFVAGVLPYKVTLTLQPIR